MSYRRMRPPSVWTYVGTIVVWGLIALAALVVSGCESPTGPGVPRLSDVSVVIFPIQLKDPDLECGYVYSPPCELVDADRVVVRYAANGSANRVIVRVRSNPHPDDPPTDTVDADGELRFTLVDGWWSAEVTLDPIAADGTHGYPVILDLEPR